MLVREILVKSILNETKIPGLDYSLNPYGGCFFGCTYCFADYMKRFYREKRPWGEWVYVKINAPEILERELKRKRPGKVSMSIVTDPYQPVESRYRISRRCIEKFEKTPFHLSILTKSPLVLRDLDLLVKLERVDVGMSIAIPDDSPYFRALERRITPASKRFEALKEIGKAGIRTWVFFNPIIRGINDSEEVMTWILEKAKEAGVERVSYDFLNPYPSVVRRLNRALGELKRPTYNWEREWIGKFREIASNIGILVD